MSAKESIITLLPYGYASSDMHIPMDIMNLSAKYPNYSLTWHINDNSMNAFKEAKVDHKMYGPITEFDGFRFQMYSYPN